MMEERTLTPPMEVSVEAEKTAVSSEKEKSRLGIKSGIARRSGSIKLGSGNNN